MMDGTPPKKSRNEEPAGSIDLKEEGNIFFKLESVGIHLQTENCKEIRSGLADQYVVTKPEMKKTIDAFMTKISDEIGSKVFETVKKSFDDAFQFCYFEFSEGLKFSLFNIKNTPL